MQARLALRYLPLAINVGRKLRDYWQSPLQLKNDTEARTTPKPTMKRVHTDKISSRLEDLESFLRSVHLNPHQSLR